MIERDSTAPQLLALCDVVMTRAVVNSFKFMFWRAIFIQVFGAFACHSVLQFSP